MRTRITLLIPLAVVGLLLAGCGSQIAGQPTRTGAASSTSTGGSAAPTGSTDDPPSDSASPPPTGDTGPLEGPIPRPTAGGTGAGKAPAGLEDFYNQKLNWQSCVPFNDSPDYTKEFAQPGLQCANVVVPLAYDDPTGPTIAIAAMRSAATGGDRVGALVMNPGGPGGSGLQFVGAVAGLKEWATLHESFDFVSFDTRGVGASRPLINCLTDTEQDAARAANNRTNTPEGVAKLNAAAAEYVAKCVERTGADADISGKSFLLNIGSSDTIQDIDVLRSAMGETKLSYLGFSYGTLLGAMYAAKFPANVRAMILDGAVDPAKDPVKMDLGQGTGFQGTFDAFAAWCAAQQSCPLGTDVTQATAKYQQLTRPLLATPLTIKDGRTLTYADATTGTFYALYSEQNWKYLRTGLINLQAGDGTLMMLLADTYLERDTDGHYGRANDIYNAVTCMDGDAVTPADSIVTQYDAAAPFQDPGDPDIAAPSLVFGNVHFFGCSLYPGPASRAPAPVSAPGVAPLVVISTTGDPATPYADGVSLAAQLGASLITFEGNRHTAFLSENSSCVDDAGTNYLVDLTLPKAGLTCK